MCPSSGPRHHLGNKLHTAAPSRFKVNDATHVARKILPKMVNVLKKGPAVRTKWSKLGKSSSLSLTAGLEATRGSCSS